MKTTLLTAMSSVCALSMLATPVYAQEITESNEPISIPVAPIPAHPTPDVRAYLLMDYDSGRILFGEHYDERIDPASLTKMMTSYVIGQELRAGKIKPTDLVTISNKAWSKNYPGSSKMFIEVGSQVSVDDLHKGIIIQSGNDACIAMSEHIAGSVESFVSLMNAWSQKIGLNDTNFENPHGIDSDNHYSTALDMAKLGRALIKDLPEEYKIYSEKEFLFNGIKQLNRNRLLWDNTLHVDGIKTGHVSRVGYNLVASAVKPENGMRLISVIIGDKSEKLRSENSKSLLQYGFRFYEPYAPIEANQTLITKNVRFGEESTIKLGTNQSVKFAIPVNSKDRVKATFTLSTKLVNTEKSLNAPIQKGEQVGILTFTLDNEVVTQVPLVALEEVKEGDFLTNLWDKIVITIKGWFE